jgi:aldehyde:ferredoxin oxidoreductase
MNGYHGKFLMVDLSNQNIQDLSISEKDQKLFIGGSTLAAKLIYDFVDIDLDPLDPRSPLIFSTGPFTGTSIPMVSRYAVCGISPLTRYWGEATSGGIFPFRLKHSGYDGIFIKGKSDNPVYIMIDNGSAQIKDATHLWGKDCYQTQDIIKKDKSNLSVACIGLAGEKQVNYAGIINDQGRAAGRCGFGAVMGSKNLKAVAVAGNLRPELANKDKVKALTKEMVEVINSNLISKAYKEYGTLMWVDMGMILGDVPVKYYQKNAFPAEKLTGLALRQNYVVENYACLGCPIGCGRIVKDFKDIDTVDGPEYETVGAFGPLCMNYDYDSIIMANHMCNSYGLDTISTGSSISYALYLYELGVLTKEKAGMELNWGDGKTIVKLIEMIANKEGIGGIISQGSKKMAQEFGREEDEPAHVKGLELPLHDTRSFTGIALSYATGPRGACHLKGDYYNVDLATAVPEFRIVPGDRLSSENKAESVAKFQNFKDMFDALTLCKFAPYTVTQICKILNAITGWSIKSKDFLKMGERSINIKRAISNKLGVTRKDDRLPKVSLKAMDEGSTAGVVPNMDLLLKEYYAYRKWDWETGKPTKEALLKVDLEDVANDLYD